jgi:carboxypeptidase Q
MNKTTTILGLAVSLWAASAVAQPADISAAIRKEGLGNSQAGAYVGELSDGIGARLMGSPNMAKAYDWTEAKLKALGAMNVHREDIGEFGLSWRQDNAWLRMSAPDSMVLLAQAQPWSAPSKGAQEGEAVAVSLSTVTDFDKYRGKLKGKIVLLGPLRAMPPVTTPLVRRWTDEELSSGQAAEVQRQYHLNIKTRWEVRAKAAQFAAQRDAFLKGEGVLALILPSRDNDMGNGGTGNILVDVSGQGWTAATRVTFPVLIASYESFGRAWRLASAGKPVRMQFEVKATTLSEHEHGFNVVGEIPGTDPKLKSQVVMLGAHLDSWGSGTGAVDNGAGVAANLEVLRILKAVGAKPRRTIRVVLFCAEEQGLYGSTAYVNKHFGMSTAVSAPRSGEVIAAADLRTLPEYETLSAYYNLDHGSGRIRGVFAGNNPEMGKLFSGWIAPLKDLGVQAVFAHRYYPADQAPFEQVSLPGVSFLQDPLDYDSRAHHSNLDTLERVVPADLAQAATVMAIFVMNTADRDERMPRLKAP